jgi:hypothetical protein
MKISNALTGLALLAVSLTPYASARAAVSLGVDFPADSAADYGVSSWNLGWSFTANSNVEVVGLGNWAGGSSFPQDQQIGLWNSSGVLLASVYVTGSETPLGSAPWVFEAITPVALVAGQTYIVGAEGGADYTGVVAAATFDPRITFITDLYTYNGGANSPLVEPVLTEGYGASAAGWFGGNIELSASATPEPSTWAMMLLGFAGLGFAGYRQRHKLAGAAGA